ncbi:diphosphoinositol-polyphosphate diphosphatase [Nematocida homosporus]|uniref:diphosphoinositol-polyphosphate diphosphatase n=1 Tax=Nematocida homosporus TaxID=1912981 RepID=UPI00221E6EED|nr:diphosphoinositol-polyphosphate diphosphatase [Nematocida homosporus]KAI5187031.1 diphosphoinositol-polyphosphate diphosphatase [Nematocida homosporus]
MKRQVITVLIGIAVCAFVLWPILLRGPQKRYSAKKTKKAKKNNPARKIVGCIPILDGQVFLVNGRRKHKLTLPKGGVDNNEPPYYAAGKEALEEAGLIGEIDTTPSFTEAGIDWYMMKVTRVLDDWKERHERVRKQMTLEDALLHSEVRAITKVVLKQAVLVEKEREHPRLRNKDLVVKNPRPTGTTEPATNESQTFAQFI